MGIIETKFCKKCSENKFIDKFRVRLDKPRKDGSRNIYINSECRTCESETERERQQKIRINRPERTCKGCAIILGINKRLDAEFCDKYCRRRWKYANDPNYNKYVKDHGREWRMNNPESNRRSVAKYRESERGQLMRQAIAHARRSQSEKIIPEHWKIILGKCNDSCLICGSKENITQDHIIPLSLNGLNCISNVQPLCKFHNCAKGARNSIDYRTDEVKELALRLRNELRCDLLVSDM